MIRALPLIRAASTRTFQLGARAQGQRKFGQAVALAQAQPADTQRAHLHARLCGRRNLASSVYPTAAFLFKNAPVVESYCLRLYRRRCAARQTYSLGSATGHAAQSVIRDPWPRRTGILVNDPADPHEVAGPYYRLLTIRSSLADG